MCKGLEQENGRAWLVRWVQERSWVWCQVPVLLVLQVLQQLRGRGGSDLSALDAAGFPALPHDVRTVLALACPHLPQRVRTARLIVVVVIIVIF